MLSLIRSRTTCQHSIKHARAALSIAKAQISSTRYVADNQGLGFGSLSVPIPIESKNRIAFNTKSAHKPQAQPAAPNKSGGDVSEKERGRRNLRNRRTHERAKLRRLKFQAKRKESASESTTTTAKTSEGQAEVRAEESQEKEAERYAEEQDQEDGLSSISARFEELDKSEASTKTNMKGKGTGRRDKGGARPFSLSQKSGDVPNTDFAPEEIEGMSGSPVVGLHADPM